MEIYSKKIGDEVLHAVPLSPTELLEGWGPVGVKSIFSRLSQDFPDEDFVSAKAATDFFTRVASLMSDGDEVLALITRNDLRNIRLTIEGVTETYPNLFVFWES